MTATHQRATTKRKTAPATQVSFHKKPDHLTLAERQRELRRALVTDKKQEFTVTRQEGDHPVFADYMVKNLSSDTAYKVALRSKKPGPNFCTCPDLKTNLLGTCKHIEAVLHSIEQNKKLAPLLQSVYLPAYSSLYLKYGSEREVRLRIGTERATTYQALAKQYCDDELRLHPTAFKHIDKFLLRAQRISPDFRCYKDVVDFIATIRDGHTRQALITRNINQRKKYFDKLITTPLYPFQKDGVLFAAKAGRSLIADDMGLGKTIQAIGAAELFQKEFGVSNVLVVCPTSLKYQWQAEIKRFCGKEAVVLEGDALTRHRTYGSYGYFIISYNVVGADIAAINKADFDLVILDEAQRIKNWQTKTAQAVKKIASKYAIVLTGTPIENKLEELYSIIQFIDPFKLGPLYKFLANHEIRNEAGKVVGYHNLNQIQKVLSDIVIRRTKQTVLKQLPSRTDKQILVPLTAEQTVIHEEYAVMVSRLVSKWKRFGFLDEKDRQRLLIALNCMRMVADSTYILDQTTRFDTKIEELMSLLDNALATRGNKVVVFSQWQRMTSLVEQELNSQHIGFAHLHGGIPSSKRKGLLDDFHNNPACLVFLSTDAGGVGLNLQSASTVINLDLPWNPAVLEQRIGRIHRHGQKQHVNVINLISKDSIEQRMIDVLKFKSSLFAGALDGGEDKIFMGEDKFKRFMGQVEHVTHQSEPLATKQNAVTPVTQSSHAKRQLPLTPDLNTAAANLFKNLAETLSDQQKSEKLISSFTAKDAKTGKPYLKIPLENEQMVTNALNALNGLISKFTK